MSRRPYYNYTADVYYREFKAKTKACTSAAYWRQQALNELKEDPSLPRQECEKCHTKFPHHYMRYVFLGSFRSGYVCQDCKKEYQLQSA